MNIMQGMLGWKGERGFSAYEIAVKNGFVGSEKDWLARLGTSSHFERDITTYTSTTQGQTEFALPESYVSDSFLDVYIEGERLGTDEYTLDIENKKIILTNGLSVVGTKVEVVVMTMSTNSLPIIESLNDTVTNKEVLGAKSLYDISEGNVKNYGAKGDGITDDTEAFNKCFKSGKKFIRIPTGTYKIGNIESAEGQTIIFEDCSFKRKEHKAGALIKIGSDCVVIGNLKVDGDKDNYSVSTESGIEFGPNNLIYAYVESYNNSKHGIILGSETYANHLVAYNNGINGDAAGNGTGDGMYLVNVNNTVLEQCTTYNNARNGISVTTYNTETNLMDKTLSKNIVIKNANSYDNTYMDVDIEGTQDVRLLRLRGNGIVCGSESANCIYQDMEISKFYANNSNYCKIERVGIRPKGAATNVFYIEGYEIKIDDVTIHDTADSYKSITFQVNDTQNKAIIKNVRVENGYNACALTGCYDVENIIVEKAANRKYIIDGRYPADSNFRIERGLLNALLPNKPATGHGFDGGTHKKCDVVYNSTLKEQGTTGNMYVVEKWVCVANGTNDSSNWLEYRSLTGN